MPALSFSPLDDADFDTLRAYLYDACGIALDHSKQALVVGRLQPVLNREGIDTYREYIARVQGDSTGTLRSELVDRLSTNHTFFWRESSHFDYLTHTIIPEFKRAASSGATRSLRIWCAASSTGQEPYTLAALLVDGLGADYARWDSGVLATDINTEVLDFARRAVYPPEDVARLPEPLRERHFLRCTDGRSAVAPRVRDEVTLRRFNLMNERYPFKQPFEIIFIRNVMIYFDIPTKQALMGRLAAALRPGGYLFIGAAESLPTDQPYFNSVVPGVFRKR